MKEEIQESMENNLKERLAYDLAQATNEMKTHSVELHCAEFTSRSHAQPHSLTSRWNIKAEYDDQCSDYTRWQRVQDIVKHDLEAIELVKNILAKHELLLKKIASIPVGFIKEEMSFACL